MFPRRLISPNLPFGGIGGVCLRQFPVFPQTACSVRRYVGGFPAHSRPYGRIGGAVAANTVFPADKSGSHPASRRKTT